MLAGVFFFVPVGGGSVISFFSTYQVQHVSNINI